jgi:hypothetical protein
MALRWPAARRKRGSPRILGLAALALALLGAYALASVLSCSYAPAGAAGAAGDRCAPPPR